ncbi:MAG: cob(I)yrinic acid a,c-diamide adenosyltransferase [Rhodospirillaceae bacterium]|nr:cob(I)yrinic acid a,c-diamide adenosyltransferase [Rhodospirillaceae bacterium]
MTDINPSPETAAQHKVKMEKKKAARDKIMASKTEARGLIIVHTGKGKGKSTAAWGLALRAMGHGQKVGIVQFVKGEWETGERTVLEERFSDLCQIRALGRGFSWESQDLEKDIAAAQGAWDATMQMMSDESIDLVICDEINIAFRYGHLDPKTIVGELMQRRAGLHVVLTGRNAPEELVEAADLVTEMTLIKHPFRSGVKAQAGVEF